MTTFSRKECQRKITIYTDDGKILFMDNNNNNNSKSQEKESPEMAALLESQKPLRRSLFGGIPPFINYVPTGGFTGKTEKGPQYWDETKVIRN